MTKADLSAHHTDGVECRDTINYPQGPGLLGTMPPKRPRAGSHLYHLLTQPSWKCSFDIKGMGSVGPGDPSRGGQRLAVRGPGEYFLHRPCPSTTDPPTGPPVQGTYAKERAKLILRTKSPLSPLRRSAPSHGAPPDSLLPILHGLMIIQIQSTCTVVHGTVGPMPTGWRFQFQNRGEISR